MEFIPIIYIFICYLVASALGSIRLIGVSISFIINLFLTPALGSLIILMFPKLPKAYCIIPYENFDVGESYYYRVFLKPDRRLKVSVFNGDQYDLDKEDFNFHFSVVTSKEVESV